MSRYVVLLRGVNLVKRNRISMRVLRGALDEAGFKDVATYVKSGNIVLSSRGRPDSVAAAVKRLIRTEFGLDIVVLVRSQAELTKVVRRNPLAHVATNPRTYLVTFLAHRLPADFGDRLKAVSDREPFAIIGREIYSWHPLGAGRSLLWEKLASKSLGVDATSRNWLTVTTLAAMSADSLKLR